MTKFRLLLCGLIAIVVISCKEDKPYSISLNGNNLYITMPHPTENEKGIDWNGVFMSDVVEDVYQQLKESSIKGECHLYVRFENVTTDKYGNKNSTFDESLIMNIPVKEVGKYQDSKYFNDYYKISEKVANVAFNKTSTSNSSETDTVTVANDQEKIDQGVEDFDPQVLEELLKSYPTKK